MCWWGIFLAVLKAAGEAEGDRAGCCGRAELDGIPPLPSLFSSSSSSSFLQISGRQRGWLPPPGGRLCFPGVALPSSRGGREGAGTGLGWAGPAAPSPPRPARARGVGAGSPRGGTFPPSPSPTPGLSSRRPPPGTPPWHCRDVRVPAPGFPEDALRQVKPSVRRSPTPGCLRSPSPCPCSGGDGARRDLQKLLSAPKPRAGVGSAFGRRLPVPFCIPKGS